MCYYEAKQAINDIFYLQKGKKMKQNRVEAVLKNMESLNLSQILITDPLANDMGVRVEDLVLVTDHGHEILNHFSKELTVID